MSPPGKGNHLLGSGTPAKDIVPLVQQHMLDGGPQSGGTLALSKQGSAMLGMERAQHCHYYEGGQHGLDCVG